MKTSSPDARDFYVYGLFGADGIIRYIGKGRGRRWKHHDRKIKSRNRIKNKFIRDTLAVMGEIPKIKIRENLTEAEAFETEVALIKAIGRRDLRTGPLTNMSDGGTGGDFGDAIKRAKAKWSPEQRQQVGKNHSKTMKAFWASMTPDERAVAEAKSISIAREKMKQLRESDPEYEIRRARKVSDGHGRRTKEQKREAAEKTLILNPPARRSESAKKWHESRTPEERSETIRKGWRDLLPEERSLRARCDPAIRSAQVKKQQANLTDEQRDRRTERARKLGRLPWITNGDDQRRLREGEALPEGWSYGRKLDRASSKRAQ